MRIARLSPCGSIAEIVSADHAGQLAAEAAALRAAQAHIGTLFAVLPDDHDEILSLAKVSPHFTPNRDASGAQAAA